MKLIDRKDWRTLMIIYWTEGLIKEISKIYPYLTFQLLEGYSSVKIIISINENAQNYQTYVENRLLLTLRPQDRLHW